MKELRSTRKGTDGGTMLRILGRGACLTLNHNLSMYATKSGAQRSAARRLLGLWGRRAPEAMVHHRVSSGTRQFVYDVRRDQPRNSRPLGTFYDAAVELLRTNPALLPATLAVVDAMRGDFLAAAHAAEPHIADVTDADDRERSTNHRQDDRVAVVVRTNFAPWAVEELIEANNEQIRETERENLCLVSILATGTHPAMNRTPEPPRAA